MWKAYVHQLWGVCSWCMTAAASLRCVRFLNKRCSLFLDCLVPVLFQHPVSVVWSVSSLRVRVDMHVHTFGTYSIRIVFLFGVVFWNILPTTEKSGPVPTKMHKAWIYRCRLPSSIPFLTKLAWYCTTPTIKASLSLNINVLTNHGNTGRFRELPSVNIFSRYRPSHHLA